MMRQRWKKRESILLKAILERIAPFTQILQAPQAVNQPLLPREPDAARGAHGTRCRTSIAPPSFPHCRISLQTPGEQGFVAQTGLLGHADGERLTQSCRLSSRRITTLAGGWSRLLAPGAGMDPVLPSMVVLGRRLLRARGTAQRERKVWVPPDGRAKQQEQQLPWWPSQQRLL